MFASRYDPSSDQSPVLSAQGFGALFTSSTRALDPQQRIQLQELLTEARSMLVSLPERYGLQGRQDSEVIFIPPKSSRDQNHVLRINVESTEGMPEYISATIMDNVDILRDEAEIRAYDRNSREALEKAYGYLSSGQEIGLTPMGVKIAYSLARSEVIEQQSKELNRPREAIAAMVDEGLFAKLLEETAERMGSELLAEQRQGAPFAAQRIDQELAKRNEGMSGFRIMPLAPRIWGSLQTEDPSSDPCSVRVLAQNQQGYCLAEYNENRVEIFDSEESQVTGTSPMLTRAVSPIDVALLRKIVERLRS